MSPLRTRPHRLPAPRTPAPRTCSPRASRSGTHRATVERRRGARSLRRLLTAFALVAAHGPAASAQGPLAHPASDANCFPFGCVVGGNASTRYQQVYAADTFAGGFRFNTISFVTDPAFQRQLNVGTFRLYLATTSVAVDALDPRHLDANLGPAPVWFGAFTIGGAAPSILSFVGATYAYDPARGNLLLDLRVDGAFTASPDVAAFVAQNGSADGAYSRATDFGDGGTGYGLETRFTMTEDPPAAPRLTDESPPVSTNAEANSDTPAPATKTVGPQTILPEPAPWMLLGVGLVAAAGVGCWRGVRRT